MLKRIGVVGGGMIGASLASLFAGYGVRVTLVEQTGMVQKARENCESVYRGLEEHSLSTPEQTRCALGRIELTDDYAQLTDMEFIFECVFERTAVKHAVYREIEKVCGNLRAIASSTSAISADELAEGFGSEELRSRLVVAHPWNPPHLAPCVEVVKSRYVCDDVMPFIQETLSSVGKKVIVLQKNIPGFIGNRLQYAMLREAIHIVEEGAATPEMIDETLRTSFAPRYTEIGLFEHFDNCGQDLALDICNYLFPDLCNANSAQRSLRENVERGYLGIKSGRGMLNWENVDLAAFRERAAAPYYRFFNWPLPADN